jgi:hypothetical protein
MVKKLSKKVSEKLAKSCQKIVQKVAKKLLKKLSKSCQKVQKVVKKKVGKKSAKSWQKSGRKVVKKLAKKLSKSCQKIVKETVKHVTNKTCRTRTHVTLKNGVTAVCPSVWLRIIACLRWPYSNKVRWGGVGLVKKCFLGLRQTALLSDEGKNDHHLPCDHLTTPWRQGTVQQANEAQDGGGIAHGRFDLFPGAWQAVNKNVSQCMEEGRVAPPA